MGFVHGVNGTSGGASMQSFFDSICLLAERCRSTPRSSRPSGYEGQFVELLRSSGTWFSSLSSRGGRFTDLGGTGLGSLGSAGRPDPTPPPVIRKKANVHKPDLGGFIASGPGAGWQLSFHFDVVFSYSIL